MNRKHLFLACWAACAITAQAATVQITVLARDGKPLADAVVVVEPLGATKAAAPPPVQAIINQEKMQFSPQVTVVPVGSTVTFINLDAWEHHVRGVPAGAAAMAGATAGGFEGRMAGKAEGKPAERSEFKLDKPGPFQLGCHLHGSMRGFLFVSDSPHTARTGADGTATLADLPEGGARVRVWHTDQVLDQPATDITVTTTTALQVPTQVAPRRRRP
jgi:plastocyanin